MKKKKKGITEYPKVLWDIKLKEKIFKNITLKDVPDIIFPKRLLKMGLIRLLLLLQSRIQSVRNPFILIERSNWIIWDVSNSSRDAFNWFINHDLVWIHVDEIFWILWLANAHICEIIEKKWSLEYEESEIVWILTWKTRDKFFRVMWTLIYTEFKPFGVEVFRIRTKFMQIQLVSIPLLEAVKDWFKELDFRGDDKVDFVDLVSKFMRNYDVDYTWKHLMNLMKLGELFVDILKNDYEESYPIVNNTKFCDHFIAWCVLHDIWKIKTPDDILHKQWRLNIEEFDIMKRHSVDWMELSRLLGFPEVVKNCISFHHEKFWWWWYPRWTSWDWIPFEARVLKIADVYESLNASRPYHKKKRTPDMALEEMHDMQERELHFDPDLFKIFVKNHSKFAKIVRNRNKDN